MRKLTLIMVLSAVALAAPAVAQTQSSGASGYVQDQDKAGIAAQPPSQYKSDATGGDASTATSAQNSGAGISGAPGNKNGPATRQGTVGSNTQDKSVQQQDPAHVQGMPGNKSGPPAKR
jgi:hypothetical protein